MPKLEMNGQTYEAFVDESLLAVARKNKAHIGYACGGNGLCQTCEVIVESGMDALSPMNDVEKAWLTAEKQKNGHRLACQCQIVADKPIKVLTRAEKARQVFNRAFKEQPKEPSTHPQGYVGEFFTWLGIETLSHLSAVPFVSVNVIQRVIDGKLTLQAVSDTINAANERFPEINQIVTDVANNLPKIASDLGKGLEPVINSTGDLLKNIGNAVSSTDLNKSLEPVVNSMSDIVKGVTDTVSKVIGSATQNTSTAAQEVTPVKVEIKK
jgi:ferredoxin